ncbi:alpha/beta hydrolase domain-containing protein [Streptomyces adelaidensis]|uniref:alpha/beta hydrolase domain-containing protein n=1 Tax=Streptomyces adelaidensis TaxID=2796465 RepID=UPI0019032952|nr:alpha/beta hydrolase domain-containing protein [Streptomyces adelaidensis]
MFREVPGQGHSAPRGVGVVLDPRHQLPSDQVGRRLHEQRYSICTGAGAQENLSADELEALYGSKGTYVKRVVRQANQLEHTGWLLPADAREIREEAAGFDGFSAT